jgi:hypothetical protein
MGDEKSVATLQKNMKTALKTDYWIPPMGNRPAVKLEDFLHTEESDFRDVKEYRQSRPVSSGYAERVLFKLFPSMKKTRLTSSHLEGLATDLRLHLNEWLVRPGDSPEAIAAEVWQNGYIADHPEDREILTTLFFHELPMLDTFIMDSMAGQIGIVNRFRASETTPNLQIPEALYQTGTATFFVDMSHTPVFNFHHELNEHYVANNYKCFKIWWTAREGAQKTLDNDRAKPKSKERAAVTLAKMNAKLKANVELILPDMPTDDNLITECEEKTLALRNELLSNWQDMVHWTQKAATDFTRADSILTTPKDVRDWMFRSRRRPEQTSSIHCGMASGRLMNYLGTVFDVPCKGSAGLKCTIDGREDAQREKAAKKPQKKKKNTRGRQTVAPPRDFHQDAPPVEGRIELSAIPNPGPSSSRNSDEPDLPEDGVPSLRRKSAPIQTDDDFDAIEQPSKRMKIEWEIHTSILNMIKLSTVPREHTVHNGTKKLFTTVKKQKLGNPQKANFPTGDLELVRKFVALHLVFMQYSGSLEVHSLKADYQNTQGFIEKHVKMLEGRLLGDEMVAESMLSEAVEENSYEIIQELLFALCHSNLDEGLITDEKVFAPIVHDDQFITNLLKEHTAATLYHLCRLEKDLKEKTLEEILVS